MGPPLGVSGTAGAGLRAGRLRRRQIRLASPSGSAPGQAGAQPQQQAGSGWAPSGQADPAGQIAQQLIDNLARLRNVLQETEQIANRIEQLSQQAGPRQGGGGGVSMAAGGSQDGSSGSGLAPRGLRRSRNGGDGSQESGQGQGQGQPDQEGGAARGPASLVRAAKRRLRQLT
ncbi:MAG: hypothetical protein QJR14_06705 [Bacillota bacterium]|nr:hypothetical protein [Bacillota bacterium]